MRRVLLDTSAYSAYRRGVVSANTAIQTADQVLVSSIVLGELRSGFAAGSRREQNEGDLRAFLALPRMGVVPVDDGTSVCYAAILASLRRSGTPVPTNDIWIAGSAMQHGLVLVTAEAHFDAIPQVLVERC